MKLNEKSIVFEGPKSIDFERSQNSKTISRLTFRGFGSDPEINANQGREDFGKSPGFYAEI